jgi:site-specific DNA-adenine methylase
MVIIFYGTYVHLTSRNGPIYGERVDGAFNIPYGHQTHVQICEEKNLRKLSELLNTFDVTFECKDYIDVIDLYPNATFYMDPPYYGTFNKYNSARFNHDEYVSILEELRENPDIELIHSNSGKFADIYDTDEDSMPIDVRIRIHSTNPSEHRKELLFFQ